MGPDVLSWVCLLCSFIHDIPEPRDQTFGSREQPRTQLEVPSLGPNLMTHLALPGNWGSLQCLELDSQISGKPCPWCLGHPLTQGHQEVGAKSSQQEEEVVPCF